MTQTPRDPQSGVTLIELVIAAAILAMIAGILTHVIISSNDAQKYSQRLNLVTEINQEILGTIQEELMSAVGLMTNDQSGQEYRALLDMSAGPTPLDTSTLPTVDTAGIFERELNTGEKTGNTLLFGRYAWSTDYRCKSGEEYRIDCYRLVYYYLARQGAGPQPGSNIGLELCRWVSEPLADGHAIDQISDPVDQAEVLQHLLNQTPDMNGKVHDRVEVVWHRRGLLTDPVSKKEDPDTLRHIMASGAMSDDPTGGRPGPPWSILRDDAQSSSGLLGYRHMSVATNFAQSTYNIGRFSVNDNKNDGFPHGFEVQVVGPSFAREVMLRLVMATDNVKGLQAKSDMRRDVFLRDF